MAKKSIAELLQEAKALKQKEAEIKAQMRQQKQVLATEYLDNMPEAEKQKQIAEAERILAKAKEDVTKAKDILRATVKKIKEDVTFAKDILTFVNYKQGHSLPKQKNSFAIQGNTLKFSREGIKDIAVDISKANWQGTFKEALKAQGLNGDNRIADNIIYKAAQLVKSNIAI